MRSACRPLAVAVLAFVGVASIVATAPPMAYLWLELVPSSGCPGASVELRWTLTGASPPPGSIRIVSLPEDAFEPPINFVLPDREGVMVTTALASAYVGVYEEHPGGHRLSWRAASVDLADCAGVGFQMPRSEFPLTAIAHDPSSGHLLTAAVPTTPDAPSELRNWTPDLEPLSAIEVSGSVRAIAVAVDGRLAVTGELPHPDPDVETTAAFAGIVSPDGAPVWFGMLEIPGVAATADSQGVAVAHAPDGGLVLAGWNSAGMLRKGFVQRYDAVGQLLWHHRATVGSNVMVHAVVVVDDGDVIVAGLTGARLDACVTSDPEVFVRALDGASGAVSWTLRGLPLSREAGRPALARLDGDRILLLGRHLTAFGADGTELWSRGAEPGHWFSALTADGAGGVFVASGVHVEVPFNMSQYDLSRRVDVLVERRDADGVVVWEEGFGSLARDLVVAIAAWPNAGDGAVAVAGTTSGSLLTPVAVPGVQSLPWSYLNVLVPGP